MINKDIKSLSFAEIKEEIHKISIIDLYKSGDSVKVLEWFKDDKRKNVLALKNKLQKELDLYINEV